MTRLSVNINKVATLRNARGGNVPNLIQFAIDCERFGAEGITVHPRPDERHIRYADVLALKDVVTTEFNIEGYPDDRYMELVQKVRPAQATLVPDPPGVLTSDNGWDVIKQMDLLRDIIQTLQGQGMRVSIFLNPDIKQVEAAKESGTDRVEFYTGPYSWNYKQDRQRAILPYAEAISHAHKLGLGINAGHDLNRENLQFFKQSVVQLDEVSIGHAIISDALYLGIENTIALFKRCLQG